MSTKVGRFRQGQRAWINQPSTLQPDHKRHGELVIVAGGASVAKANGQVYRDVYLLVGDATSMRISEHSLSAGWPEHLRRKVFNSAP